MVEKTVGKKDGNSGIVWKFAKIFEKKRKFSFSQVVEGCMKDVG